MSQNKKHSSNIGLAAFVFVLIWIAGFIGYAAYDPKDKYEINFSIEPTTVSEILHRQPAMKCYSAFDVHIVRNYHLDGNTSLITHNDRVYHIDDCKEYHDNK